jgi:transcriptional regulator GlxA family with amidase domain
MAKSATIPLAIVGYPDCSVWITGGLVELFAIANVAIRTLPRALQRACFDCHVVAQSRRNVRASHGAWFEAHSARRRYDAVIVPPLWGESRAQVEERAARLRSLTPFLQALARRSGIIASACSGALLLAHAGLLANRRATTCWWLAESLQRRFPDVELVADRLVVCDGNVWTAAAGSAYIHLGLELVARFAGAKACAATARLMLVERRRGSQSPFMARDSESDDATVARAARYLDQNAGDRIAIASACHAVRVSERTLARKFRASLGMSPLTYLQSRRVARAKQLLEDTPLSLERIIEQCGYEDISSFRKLFARHVGMTPREYRSRFGSPAPPRS